jgi:signal transduction histidine kinase/ActR/RegA family two-component response regulator
LTGRQRTQADLLAEIAALRRELAEVRAGAARVRADADASLHARSSFLANMSHEIRTPMTSVLGYVDMLIEEASASNAPPERIAQLHAIKRSGRHLVHLLNDILDLSRIEAGKLAVERAPVSIFQLVDDVMSVMRPTAASKQLRLELDYDGRLPERVETDATRLRQVLLNLVGNAIKFTEVGGVRVRVQFLERAPGPSLLQFLVADTGIGIAPDVAAQLFRPFCQGDGTHARRFGGAGLGLAISREIARLLGGDIELESAEGWGSTFILRIAAGPAPDSRLIEAREFDPLDEDETLDTLKFIQAVGEASRGDRHVLVVDDCDDNARIVSHLLRNAGFRTTRAENGREAVKLALAASDRAPFDLILMDVQMPVMSGYDAARTLRMNGYEGPILALTANAMREERQRSLAAGCDGFATKPIDRKELLVQILTLIGKRGRPDEPDPAGWMREPG